MCNGALPHALPLPCVHVRACALSTDSSFFFSAGACLSLSLFGASAVPSHCVVSVLVSLKRRLPSTCPLSRSALVLSFFPVCVPGTGACACSPWTRLGYTAARAVPVRSRAHRQHIANRHTMAGWRVLAGLRAALPTHMTSGSARRTYSVCGRPCGAVSLLCAVGDQVPLRSLRCVLHFFCCFFSLLSSSGALFCVVFVAVIYFCFWCFRVWCFPPCAQGV